MLKKFKISVDGKTYDVVVEDVSGGSLPAAAPSTPAVAAPVAPVAPVAPPPPPVAAPQPTAAAPAGANAIVSPLAGVVDSIDVQVGQAIKVGDKVAVVEAMKMKTEIFAKTAGTVSSIAVKVHDAIDTGQALITLS